VEPVFILEGRLCIATK